MAITVAEIGEKLSYGSEEGRRGENEKEMVCSRTGQSSLRSWLKRRGNIQAHL
jgi:hypothetical protein